MPQEQRYQHAWVLGQTGTGKSSWARQSFMQDVMGGRGACYFDFHGEDARWLLDHIPKDRIEDVVYFDPLDPNFALGYNPLDGVSEKHFASYTDEIVGALRHIFASSWGPRMDDILMNAIRPLFDLPPQSKGTLLGSVRMLNDPMFRRFVVDRCNEPTVKDFWLTEFAGWSKNDRAHNLNSSLNKIRRFGAIFFGEPREVNWRGSGCRVVAAHSPFYRQFEHFGKQGQCAICQIRLPFQ